MNYEQADKVKGLAAPVNKVLEGLEWECPVCKGRGGKDYEGKIPWPCLGPKCISCNASGKVKHKWQPKVGEWCIIDGSISLIIGFLDDGRLEVRRAKNTDPVYIRREHKALTPILPWEEIERVLEEAGYRLWVDRDWINQKYYCKIAFRDKKLWEEGKQWNWDILVERREGKSRQEAVMKAVIELGKKLK